MRFELKALGPDNQSDTAQLVALFNRVYGENYPYRGVYNRQFWRSHIGTRFTSIVAHQDGDIFAHLALEPDIGNPKNLQLSLMAYDPERSDLISEVSSAGWDVVTSQSLRNGRDLYYCLAFADSPETIKFLDDIVDARTVAICPAYLPKWRRGWGEPTALSRNGSLPTRQTAVVMVRPFDRGSPRSLSLRAPEQYQQLIEALLAPSWQPTFTSAAVLSEANDATNGPAVERFLYRETGVVQVFIRPGKVLSASEIKEAVSAEEDLIPYARVDLGYPSGLEACETLETQGWVFLGVIPELQGICSALYAPIWALELTANGYPEDLPGRMQALLDYTSHRDCSQLLAELQSVPDRIEFDDTMIVANVG